MAAPRRDAAPSLASVPAAPGKPDPVAHRRTLSPWTGLLLALVLGPFAYFYTKQMGRFWVTSLIGLVALVGACAYTLPKLMSEVDLNSLAGDPTALANATASCVGTVTLVGVVYVVAIAADVFWQILSARPPQR